MSGTGYNTNTNRLRAPDPPPNPQATIYEIKIPATALTAVTGMSVLQVR